MTCYVGGLQVVFLVVCILLQSQETLSKRNSRVHRVAPIKLLSSNATPSVNRTGNTTRKINVTLSPAKVNSTLPKRKVLMATVAAPANTLLSETVAGALTTNRIVIPGRVLRKKRTTTTQKTTNTTELPQQYDDNDTETNSSQLYEDIAQVAKQLKALTAENFNVTNPPDTIIKEKGTENETFTKRYVYVPKSSPLNLSCSKGMKALKPFSDFQWLFGNLTIYPLPKSNRLRIGPNFKLMFQHVDTTDSGQYTCGVEKQGIRYVNIVDVHVYVPADVAIVFPFWFLTSRCDDDMDGGLKDQFQNIFCSTSVTCRYRFTTVCQTTPWYKQTNSSNQPATVQVLGVKFVDQNFKSPNCSTECVLKAKLENIFSEMDVFADEFKKVGTTVKSARNCTSSDCPNDYVFVPETTVAAMKLAYLCDAGYILYRRSACVPCWAGEFSPSRGLNEQCTPCPALTYQPNPAASECIHCPNTTANVSIIGATSHYVCPIESKNKKKEGMIVYYIIAFVVLIIFFICVLIILYHFRRKLKRICFTEKKKKEKKKKEKGEASMTDSPDSPDEKQPLQPTKAASGKSSAAAAAVGRKPKTGVPPSPVATPRAIPKLPAIVPVKTVTVKSARPVAQERATTSGAVAAERVTPKTETTPGAVAAKPVKPKTATTSGPEAAEPVKSKTATTPGAVAAKPVKSKTATTPGPEAAEPVKSKTATTPGPDAAEPVKSKSYAGGRKSKTSVPPSPDATAATVNDVPTIVPVKTVTVKSARPVAQERATTPGPEAAEPVKPKSATTPGPEAAKPVKSKTATTSGPEAAEPVKSKTATTPGPEAAEPVKSKTVTTSGPEAAEPVKSKTVTTSGPEAAEPVKSKTATTPGPEAAEPVKFKTATTPGSEAAEPVKFKTATTPGPEAAEPVKSKTVTTSGPEAAEPVKSKTATTPGPEADEPVKFKTATTPGPEAAEPVKSKTVTTSGPEAAEPVKFKTATTPGPEAAEPVKFKTATTPGPEAAEPVKSESYAGGRKSKTSVPPSPDATGGTIPDVPPIVPVKTVTVKSAPPAAEERATTPGPEAAEPVKSKSATTPDPEAAKPVKSKTATTSGPEAAEPVKSKSHSLSSASISALSEPTDAAKTAPAGPTSKAAPGPAKPSTEATSTPVSPTGAIVPAIPTAPPTVGDTPPPAKVPTTAPVMSTPTPLAKTAPVTQPTTVATKPSKKTSEATSVPEAIAPSVSAASLASAVAEPVKAGTEAASATPSPVRVSKSAQSPTATQTGVEMSPTTTMITAKPATTTTLVAPGVTKQPDTSAPPSRPLAESVSSPVASAVSQASQAEDPASKGRKVRLSQSSVPPRDKTLKSDVSSVSTVSPTVKPAKDDEDKPALLDLSPSTVDQTPLPPKRPPPSKTSPSYIISQLSSITQPDTRAVPTTSPIVKPTKGDTYRPALLDQSPSGDASKKKTGKAEPPPLPTPPPPRSRTSPSSISELGSITQPDTRAVPATSPIVKPTKGDTGRPALLDQSPSGDASKKKTGTAEPSPLPTPPPPSSKISPSSISQQGSIAQPDARAVPTSSPPFKPLVPVESSESLGMKPSDKIPTQTAPTDIGSYVPRLSKTSPSLALASTPQRAASAVSAAATPVAAPTPLRKSSTFDQKPSPEDEKQTTSKTSREDLTSIDQKPPPADDSKPKTPKSILKNAPPSRAKSKSLVSELDRAARTDVEAVSSKSTIGALAEPDATDSIELITSPETLQLTPRKSLASEKASKTSSFEPPKSAPADIGSVPTTTPFVPKSPAVSSPDLKSSAEPSRQKTDTVQKSKISRSLPIQSARIIQSDVDLMKNNSAMAALAPTDAKQRADDSKQSGALISRRVSLPLMREVSRSVLPHPTRAVQDVAHAVQSAAAYQPADRSDQEPAGSPSSGITVPPSIFCSLSHISIPQDATPAEVIMKTFERLAPDLKLRAIRVKVGDEVDYIEIPQDLSIMNPSRANSESRFEPVREHANVNLQFKYSRPLPNARSNASLSSSHAGSNASLSRSRFGSGSYIVSNVGFSRPPSTASNVGLTPSANTEVGNPLDRSSQPSTSALPTRSFSSVGAKIKAYQALTRAGYNDGSRRSVASEGIAPSARSSTSSVKSSPAAIGGKESTDPKTSSKNRSASFWNEQTCEVGTEPMRTVNSEQ